MSPLVFHEGNAGPVRRISLGTISGGDTSCWVTATQPLTKTEGTVTRFAHRWVSEEGPGYVVI